MRLLLIFIILITAYSCSKELKVQYHYRKAIENGLKIEVATDTIRVLKVDSFPVIVNDTIVWEKYIAYRDTVIRYQNQIIEIPKTRWQTRIEYKERVKIEKIKGDTEVKVIREQAKIAKATKEVKYRTRWWPFVVGLIIGLIIPYLLQGGLLDRFALWRKL
jgi:hypothetical protein